MSELEVVFYHPLAKCSQHVGNVSFVLDEVEPPRLEISIGSSDVIICGRKKVIWSQSYKYSYPNAKILAWHNYDKSLFQFYKAVFITQNHAERHFLA
jgi:hypothetical protein